MEMGGVSLTFSWEIVVGKCSSTEQRLQHKLWSPVSTVWGL